MTDISPQYVWPKVERRGLDECWPWLGNANKRGGHGVAYIGNGRSMSAARAVFQLLVRPLDADEVIDHLCRNPICVNPTHLEPVTQAENVRRGTVADSNRDRGAAVTHCPQGHGYTAENTYSYFSEKTGKHSRQCRICILARNRAAKARAVNAHIAALGSKVG